MPGFFCTWNKRLFAMKLLMDEIRQTNWYGRCSVNYTALTHSNWCRSVSINYTCAVKTHKEKKPRFLCQTNNKNNLLFHHVFMHEFLPGLYICNNSFIFIQNPPKGAEKLGGSSRFRRIHGVEWGKKMKLEFAPWETNVPPTLSEESRIPSFLYVYRQKDVATNGDHLHKSL